MPEKRIALSFDDIPRAPGAWLDQDERTRMLIDALDKADVEQAVFFLNPGALSDPARGGGEARIAAYVEAGHLIANHTNTHPRLAETDLDTWIADVDAAEKWLEGREGYRPWLRYPYLDEGGQDAAKRDASRAAIAERGLEKAWVTVNASDWVFEGVAKEYAPSDGPLDREKLGAIYVEHHVEAAEFYDRLARRVTGRSPVHMMLLHETDMAALFVEDLVAALRAKGWTIVSPDAAIADPAYREQPVTDWAGGTLFEQMAWQRGLENAWWDGNNEAALRDRIEAMAR